jgi:ABC-2 type transport system permease protein/lipopolysaccharide transport system permease protein
MATDVSPVAGVLGGVDPEATREPPASIRFRRRVSMVRGVRDLWHGRELIASLAERDLRARYKQAYLGFAWAVILPLVYMVIFSLFFKRVAKIDTGDVPYALFTYVGLLPWTFFSGSVSGGASSLTGNLSVLNKVFCPREIFPLAGMVVQFVDMLIATGVLLILFAIYTYPPQLAAVWIPVLLAVQIAFTIGVSLIVAVTTVFLRDIKHAVSIGLQLGLFATPVAYSLSAIPSDVRPFYCLVNPLAPVIDGYRETVLLGNAPDLGLLGLGAIGALVTLVGGYWLFKRLEPGIADVA